MNQLHGIVLELFKKDKKKYKISDVLYGKKALEKYVEVSFKDRDEKEKKKYMKQWDSSKLGNSVYFVYTLTRGKNNQIKKTGHRFVSNASKKGGHSYLGHIDTNSFKLRRSKKRIKQRGGLIPCAPCAVAVVPTLSAGAKMAMGALGTGYFVSKSSSSSSSVISKDGKKSIKRSEVYELNKNGKKTKKRFFQNGKNLVINGKKSRSRSLKDASKKYNKLVKRCLKSGFKKC